jgi:hypothetical protein
LTAFISSPPKTISCIVVSDACDSLYSNLREFVNITDYQSRWPVGTRLPTFKTPVPVAIRTEAVPEFPPYYRTERLFDGPGKCWT